MHRVLVLMLSVQPIPASSPSAAVGDTVELTGNLDGEVLAVTLVKLVDPAGAKNRYTTQDWHTVRGRPAPAEEHRHRRLQGLPR